MIMISLSQLMLMDCSYAPLELSVQDVLVIFSVLATLFGTIFSHSFNRDKCISHNAITSVPCLGQLPFSRELFSVLPFILVAAQVAASSHYLPPAMPYMYCKRILVILRDRLSKNLEFKEYHVHFKCDLNKKT